MGSAPLTVRMLPYLRGRGVRHMPTTCAASDIGVVPFRHHREAPGKRGRQILRRKQGETTVGIVWGADYKSADIAHDIKARRSPYLRLSSAAGNSRE